MPAHIGEKLLILAVAISVSEDCIARRGFVEADEGYFLRLVKDELERSSP